MSDVHDWERMAWLEARDADPRGEDDFLDALEDAQRDAREDGQRDGLGRVPQEFGRRVEPLRDVD